MKLCLILYGCSKDFKKWHFDFEICFKDTEYTRTTLRGNQ